MVTMMNRFVNHWMFRFMITMQNWLMKRVNWWVQRVWEQGVAHWRRVGEGMMDGVGMMWSHMAVGYWRRMVERKMMMDGSSGLSSGDSVGAEGNYGVGEWAGVESLVGQERVHLHLGAGWD